MHVLVVDDELSIRNFVAEFLRREGFEVAEACSAAHALAVARELGSTLDAVVSDLNMPEMNGIQMWKHMNTLLSPQCRVLFMSEDTKELLQDEETLPGELLRKPFSLNLLKEKLSSTWNPSPSLSASSE